MYIPRSEQTFPPVIAVSVLEERAHFITKSKEKIKSKVNLYAIDNNKKP